MAHHIPIFDRQRRLAFFKLAKDPADKSDAPKMLADCGSHAELYGWERLRGTPQEIIICEGEFDRLVLESHGLAAVTGTAGAGTFPAEWAEAFREIPRVYVCFDRDEAGCKGAERVTALVPQARVVELPNEVGEGGDVTDFFVRLRKTDAEFRTLLDTAKSIAVDPPRCIRGQPRAAPTSDSETERLKALLPIEQLVSHYCRLQPTGQNFRALCLFHNDRTPSLVVFPSTHSFYCFGCQAGGDVFSFLMRIEHLTFAEALRVIRQLTSSP